MYFFPYYLMLLSGFTYLILSFQIQNIYMQINVITGVKTNLINFSYGTGFLHYGPAYLLDEFVHEYKFRSI